MKFNTGDRVAATFYGERREGTVDRHVSSIVWVKWDGHKLPTWQFPKSLTLIGKGA